MTLPTSPAFGPALLGALVGGGCSIFGAYLAQEHRAKIEESRARTQIACRVRTGLRAMLAACSTFRDIQQKDGMRSPISRAILESLLVSWTGFDRISDQMIYLGDAEFQEAVRWLFDQVRRDAESAMQLDADLKEVASVRQDMPLKDIVAVREHKLEMILALWEPNARSLLARLDEIAPLNAT